MKWLAAVLVLVGLGFTTAAPAAAQWLSEQLHGVTGGVVLDVGARGPWTSDGWRQPVPRLLLTTAVSAVYTATSARGSRWRDFGRRSAGAILAELVIDDVVLILHRGDR